MIISKTLLLKGLGGAGALLGAGGLVMFRKEIFGVNKVMDLSSFKDKELIEKVGLDCGLDGDDIGSETKECSVKTGGTINVKKGDQKEEGVSYSNTPKLKASKSESGGYSKKLKFVVDSGDINLTKAGSTSTINKLEQFETYEITEEGGKFYLTRKTEAKDEKKNILGLSKCDLPASGDSNCSFTTEEIKTVKFDGLNGQQITVSNGNVTLKISKMNDTTTFGDDNYRFTFTFPSDVTISSTNTVKANIPTDFKIKKTNNSNTLTLEKAWTETNLGAKVNLTCNNSGNNECTIGSALKVMQEDNKDTNLSKNTSGSNGGKIKVIKDQEGYNQGFKFTIEEGSITLDGSTATEENKKIKSLDEYETYEIKEVDNEWYLVRKDKAKDFLKSALGIKDNCSFPEGSTVLETCSSIGLEDLKKIKFEGHNGHNWSGDGVSVDLEIAKDASLSGGFKFTFKNKGSSSITLPAGASKTIELKNSTGELDYKIKKASGSKTLTLEKAWSVDEMVKKVSTSGITCTEQNKQCTIANNAQISVWKDGSNYWKNATVSSGSNATLTYEEGVKGFNKGFKFSSSSSISLTQNSSSSGSSSGSNPSFEANGTYEITQETFGSDSSKTWCFKKKT